MHHFANILYVSHGTTDETGGLKQALSLARNNKAPLKVLIACPEFADDMPDFRKKYEDSLLEQANTSINATRTLLNIADEEIEISVELASDDRPSIRIVKEVLHHDHDLLVKEAEIPEQGGGFRAIDMALLRKCPCPVWLSRPIERSRNEIQVAVAIDPEGEQEAAQALSRRMLELSRSLADSCSGMLQVVSCWDFEYENFLRNNPWSKKSEQEIAEIVAETRGRHCRALDRLINESGMDGAYEIHHRRGRAEDMIPAFVAEQQIDILVMGTVARTGIAGWMIGNTAENIVQELTCSLIALKPQGFVSPVKG